MVGLPPCVSRLGSLFLGNRMPPGLAFRPRQLQGYGKSSPTPYQAAQALAPRGLDPPPSEGMEGALAASPEETAAELEHRRLAFPPPPTSLPSSLPMFLSAASPKGDVGLTGHLPWARDGGGDARQELAC